MSRRWPRWPRTVRWRPMCYPTIAGQYPDYLLKALNDYHKGARKNPIMGAIAKPLTKADMQNLAAYYGSLPGPLTHRK
ncbi:MAG: hypothetical protein MUF32_06085 [Burkholderiaceae bacterium]|nr:hypothetical protein [Burkholderiaceae bacterium]